MTTSKPLHILGIALLSAAAIALVCAIALFAQGLYYQHNYGTRFSPETAGTTQNAATKALFDQQDAALHAPGHLSIEDAMKAEAAQAQDRGGPPPPR